MLLQAVGAADRSEPPAAGRCRRTGVRRSLHIVTGSSPTGTQFVQSVGCAHASSYLNPNGDEVTLVCTGEGATSEGEFWESLNHRVPGAVASAVPGGGQRFRDLHSGGMPDARRKHFEDRHRFPGPLHPRGRRNRLRRLVDGDVRCGGDVPRGPGPALVHAHVIRPYSHSLSDDERLYKTAAERAAEAQRDPLVRYPEWLTEHGILGREEMSAIIADIDRELQQATERALKARPPARGTTLQLSVSPKVDPTSSAFDTAPVFSGRSAHDGRRNQHDADGRDAPRQLGHRLRRGRRGLQPRRKSAAKSKARAEYSRRQPVCRFSSAPNAASIRRSPKRPSSAGQPGWQRAA